MPGEGRDRLGLGPGGCPGGCPAARPEARVPACRERRLAPRPPRDRLLPGGVTAVLGRLPIGMGCAGSRGWEGVNCRWQRLGLKAERCAYPSTRLFRSLCTHLCVARSPQVHGGWPWPRCSRASGSRPLIGVLVLSLAVVPTSPAGRKGLGGEEAGPGPESERDASGISFQPVL